MNIVENTIRKGYDERKNCIFSKGNNNTIQRGEIYYADLSPTVGCEQGGVRPVLVVQNDVGNKYSPTVIVAAITSRQSKNSIPTHIKMESEECGLPVTSIVLLEQVRTLDKLRLKQRVGRISNDIIKRIDSALAISFGITELVAS